MTYQPYHPNPANQPPPPPGMYPDPDGSGYRRWWDGRQWHPVQVPPPPGPTDGQKFVTWVKAHPKISGGIAAAVVIVGIAGAAGSENSDRGPDTAADSPRAVAQADDGTAEDVVEVEPTPTPEPEPVDTDGDGVIDEDDYRPANPKVRTADDVDTDKDGVADYKDAFPKDPEFSVDTDDDRVPDRLDDFPEDARYSKDSDGDHVADSADAFPSDPARSKITVAMDNALEAAENYLSFSGFSRLGLIGQLSSDYGDGYDLEDATWAVDQLHEDWNKQAVRSAKNYLSFTSFSRQGLIEQLSSSYGDQYTVEQAAYAADKVGL